MDILLNDIPALAANKAAKETDRLPPGWRAEPVSGGLWNYIGPRNQRHANTRSRARVWAQAYPDKKEREKMFKKSGANTRPTIRNLLVAFVTFTCGTKQEVSPATTAAGFISGLGIDAGRTNGKGGHRKEPPRLHLVRGFAWYFTVEVKREFGSLQVGECVMTKN